ncbi:hypothetical protein STRDD13_00235 [Streptococcus sp. DD13]|nr:hypothetical protein STRDD13_00235 [Streptococcus sp. DD13]
MPFHFTVIRYTASVSSHRLALHKMTLSSIFERDFRTVCIFN